MSTSEETMMNMLNLIKSLKETIEINTKSIMAQNFMLFALLKNSPKEQQLSVLEMLKQVSEADLPLEANESLQSSIQLVSSLIASNSPEDLRKLFRVIPGGKTDA